MTKYTKQRKEWWAAHLAALKSSGLSLRAYAAKHNLAKSTLRDHISKAKNEICSDLVQIPMSGIKHEAKDTNLSGLYLELQNGAKLQISNNFNSETFSRVLLSINNL